MICVDHPSDVILLRFTDPIIPESLRLEPVLKSAEDWKKAGDTAFLQKDFPTAVFCYSEAIEQATDDTFKAPIYTKRAGTNLLLGRYDGAMADSLASRTGAASDWKAYYNAGRAVYGFCEYKTSHEYLEKALELNANGSGVRKEYDRCLARLEEEEHGDYDFKEMHEMLNAQNVYLDRGSFLRRTFIANSEHHGRGLFAAQDIKVGELVFVEKATFMPNQYIPSRASAALYAMMVRQLCDNPSLGNSVLQMHPGDYERSGLEGTTVDGVPVLDVFLVEDIRIKNCFSTPLSTLDDSKLSSPDGRLAKGLWVHAACMNHSCVPNTMRSFLGDMFISRTTKDIAKGEELFQTYIPVKPLPNLRNEGYQSAWGFGCNCPLCTIERTSSPSMLAKRREAFAQVEKACNKRDSSKGIIPDATIRKIERLQKQLEDLHESEVYDGMPRLMLIHPCNWLVEAFRGRKNWPRALKYGVRVLRNFGFDVPLEEGAGWDPRRIWDSKHSLMTNHAVAALRRLAQAYEETGRKKMGQWCREAAAKGYTMVTGFENEVVGIHHD